MIEVTVGPIASDVSDRSVFVQTADLAAVAADRSVEITGRIQVPETVDLRIGRVIVNDPLSIDEVKSVVVEYPDCSVGIGEDPKGNVQCELRGGNAVRR